MGNKSEDLNKLEEKPVPRPERSATKNKKNKLVFVINYLKDNYDFRFNLITQKLDWKKRTEKEYKFFNERAFYNIMLDVQLNGFSVTEQEFKTIINSDMVSTNYSPFLDYINGLAPWDGETDYIKQFTDQLVLEDDKMRFYVEGGFKKWMVALVVGMIEDLPLKKYINQQCIVLVGAQGKFKSTFLASIVPEHLKMQYFYSGNFNVHSKDHEELLGTKMVIDLDEMATLNRSEIESIKSRLTQEQIVLRRAYGKAEIQLKRRASFCGSINREEFLTDLTGTRRFLVYKIKDIKFNPDFNVDKMYAQAFALYESGFEYWFDRLDISLIEEFNEPFKQKGMEEEFLTKYFYPPSEADIEAGSYEMLTASDISNYIADPTRVSKMNINNTVSKNIGIALKSLGFTQISKRMNGMPRKVWLVRKTDLYSQNVAQNSENEALI